MCTAFKYRTFEMYLILFLCTNLQDLSKNVDNLHHVQIFKIIFFEVRQVLVGNELHGLVIFFMAFSGM
jgi:hypothetical protein